MRNYTQFYINGQWVDPVTPQEFDVINPATEEVCAKISLGSEADVNKAVAAAKAAFETFSRTSRQERIELLESCVAAYKNHYMDIANAIREEMGAPQSLAIAPDGLTLWYASNRPSTTGPRDLWVSRRSPGNA